MKTIKTLILTATLALSTLVGINANESQHSQNRSDDWVTSTVIVNPVLVGQYHNYYSMAYIGSRENTLAFIQYWNSLAPTYQVVSIDGVEYWGRGIVKVTFTLLVNR